MSGMPLNSIGASDAYSGQSRQAEERHEHELDMLRVHVPDGDERPHPVQSSQRYSDLLGLVCHLPEVIADNCGQTEPTA